MQINPDIYLEKNLKYMKNQFQSYQFMQINPDDEEVLA